MNFREYYKSLDVAGRREYARKVGLSPTYIYCHLVADPPNRVPPLGTIKRMADATDGVLTFEDMIEYFLEAERARGAA